MNDLVARKQALPLGFDYNAYLYYNPDVAYSWDHDLATHWILYGQSEGRQYKFPAETTPVPNTDIPPQPDSNPLGTGTDTTVTTTPVVPPPPQTSSNGLPILLAIGAGLLILHNRKKQKRT